MSNQSNIKIFKVTKFKAHEVLILKGILYAEKNQSNLLKLFDAYKISNKDFEIKTKYEDLISIHKIIEKYIPSNNMIIKLLSSRIKFIKEAMYNDHSWSVKNDELKNSYSKTFNEELKKINTLKS